ncbi:hypothetical protein BYT27DRAFT_7091515 [Phlegmacium glaucopus]|nr:hypothetical protein BYT27DRAFT_7091515 [Phlegmacium glaucopus]
MTNNSPRKRFLDLIAPRWRTPRCPGGNMHNAGLCMGSSVSDDIGRRYFYCNSRPSKSPQCATGDDARSPVLPETTRNRLRNALQVFDKAMASGLTFQSATAQGLADFSAQECAHLAIIRLTESMQKSALQVNIYIYLTAGDTYIKQIRTLRNGTYSIYSDPTLCSLINFSNLRWSVYDRFREEFIPIATFSNLAVLTNEFLVLRRSSFVDKDCEGLDDLLADLKSLGLHNPCHLKRARAEDDTGPSKRRKPNTGDDVLDWGDL